VEFTICKAIRSSPTRVARILWASDLASYTRLVQQLELVCSWLLKPTISVSGINKLTVLNRNEFQNSRKDLYSKYRTSKPGTVVATILITVLSLAGIILPRLLGIETDQYLTD